MNINFTVNTLKMNKTLVAVLALLLLTAYSLSQKKFTVNVYGGYTMPLSDMKGTFPDTLGFDIRRSKTLLTSFGINAGVQGKYVVDSLGNARVTGALNYNTFSGSQDYKVASGIMTYKNRVNIITLSAGMEYVINPLKKYVPFIGLEIAANFYDGMVEGTGDSIFTLNRKSETRFGVVGNAGVELKFWKSTGIVIGIKYAMTNLAGKKSEIIKTNTPIQDTGEIEGLGEGYELPLNDEYSSTSTNKILNYLQFYAGLSINFGKKIIKK